MECDFTHDTGKSHLNGITVTTTRASDTVYTSLTSWRGTTSSMYRTFAPPILIVHLAIITANIFFGGGAVIGYLGLPGVNPILVALIREGISGPFLCIIAYLIDKLCHCRYSF